MEQAPEYALSALPDHLSKPDAAYYVGRQSIALEQSEAVERHLVDLEQTLTEALQAGEISARDLIGAVIERQRLLAQVGRDVATGKHANRGLRELVRGLLAAAGRGDGQVIESVLRELGTERVDRRQLRLHGTSLGNGDSDEG